jgi:hypothetical protein
LDTFFLAGNANVCPLAPDRIFSNIGFSTPATYGKTFVLDAMTIASEAALEEVHNSGFLGTELKQELFSSQVVLMAIDAAQIAKEGKHPTKF